MAALVVSSAHEYLVRQPPNQEDYSGDCATRDRQQQNDYAGDSQLEFAITAFVRGRKRTLRKIWWWSVSGHPSEYPVISILPLEAASMSASDLYWRSDSGWRWHSPVFSACPPHASSLP